MNNLSYGNWETLNDRQHDIFSQDIFLDGECAASVKDYVMGAVKSCGCPDTEEELHHHSPVLMREIEKQQEMLPDMKVKIGESLDSLNEVIDVVVEQELLKEFIPASVLRAPVPDGKATEALQAKMEAIAAALEAQPSSSGLRQINKYIVDEFNNQLKNITTVFEAGDLLSRSLKKAQQKYVRSGKVNQAAFEKLVIPYLEFLEDPKRKGGTTTLDPKQVSAVREPNQAFADALMKVIKDGALEEALAATAGIRFGMIVTAIKEGLPLIIRQKRQGSAEQAAAAAGISARYGDVVKLPLYVDKDKKYGDRTFLQVLQNILEPMVKIIQNNTLVKGEKEEQIKKFLKSALAKNNLDFPDITDGSTHRVLLFPVDREKTIDGLKDELGDEIASEYSDNEWEQMMLDSGIVVPEIFKLNQIIKTAELGGKKSGTATETGHLISFNAQVAISLGSKENPQPPAPNNTYDLVIKKNSQGTDLEGGTILKVEGPLVQPPGDPKADFILPTASGDVFISHKDGKSPTAFQQWGGTSDFGNSNSIKIFLDALRQPNTPGIQPDPDDETKIRMENNTTLAFDPFLGNTKDKTFKSLLLKSMFGKDLATDDKGVLPQQKSGLNNADFMIQNKMVVDKKGNTKLDMLPTHALSRKSIEGKTYDEAFEILFGEDSDYADYTPVIMGNYRSGRNNHGVKFMRSGVNPAMNRKIRAILVPEDGKYVWKDKDAYMKYVDAMKVDSKTKKYLKNKFNFGRE